MSYLLWTSWNRNACFLSERDEAEHKQIKGGKITETLEGKLTQLRSLADIFNSANNKMIVEGKRLKRKSRQLLRRV